MDIFTRGWKRPNARDSPDNELDSSSVKKKKKSPTYGLEVLYQPEDNSKSTYDIVFVHGLRGSIQTTWLHQNSTACWPKDFISQDLTDVRIFAFGYDADIVNAWNPASKSRITNHAQDLVGTLAGERNITDSNERKIIFVGHSLGGLIIQQALCASKNAVEDYVQQILECTYAIAFMGTPHLGADLARWAAFGSQLMNVFKCSNTGLLDVLQSGSEMLAQVQENFHKILRIRERNGRPIQVTCFYEQLPLQVTGELVVSMQSAVLPAYPSYGIHANHMNMVKFETRSDDGYQTVLRSLLIWQKDLFRMISTQISGCPLSAEDERLIQWFYTCDYDNHKMQLPSAVAGTLEWLQPHQKYTQWKTESMPSILWMTADPGCGKSVLVSYLIDQLCKDHTAGTFICYFFFSDSDRERNDSSSMLRCILHQLFSAHPFLFRHAKSELRSKGRRVVEQFATMWKIFSAVIMDPKCPEICCLVDALDECECDSRRLLIGNLSRLFDTKLSPKSQVTRIRFFITSRPLEFLRSSSLGPYSITLGGEEVVELINNDIILVIRARIDSLTQKRRISKDVHRKLTQRLCKDADQTFLWATLVLDMLDDSAKASEEALDSITKDLPRDLDEIYTKLLSHTSDIDMARKVLHIVVAAFRPLTLKEINLALAIHPDDSSIADVRRKLDPSIDHALRKICGPIIRITDSRVTLVHLTAKSFLLRGPLHPLTSAKLWHQALNPVESNTILANACTKYLLLEEIQNDCILDTIYQSDAEGELDSPCASTTSEIIRKGDPYDEERLELIVDTFTRRYEFLDYSAKHWTQHYRLSERNTLAPRTRQLCCQHGGYYTWFYVYATSSPMWRYEYHELSDLMVASYFGLEEVAAGAISRRDCIDETDDNHWTALMYAAWSGSENIVNMLLETGANVNAIGDSHTSTLRKGYTALLAAAENGHAGIVQLLIDRGAKIKIDTDTQLPLSMAAGEGHEKVVATLLEKGCDIEERNYYGQVPIHHACLNGRADMVRYLVSRGADVFARDRHGRNALDMAAESGSTDIVRGLLAKGADVNGTDCFGTTAFDLAHAFGHFEILRILVDHGAKDPYLGNIDDYHLIEPKNREVSYNSRLQRLSLGSFTGRHLVFYFPWTLHKTMIRRDSKGKFEENQNWFEELPGIFQEQFDKMVAQLERLHKEERSGNGR